MIPDNVTSLLRDHPVVDGHNDLLWLARAKTGTLNSVVALSGHVSTDGGRLLTFSVVLNEVADPAAARDAVDRAVAALALL